MKTLEVILGEVEAEAAGFKVKEAHAETLVRLHPAAECLEWAQGLLLDSRYQVRELAVFLLGNLAADSAVALATLKETVSRDDNWRVQEILAKAFDRYCGDNGYEKSLPTIRDWLGDAHPNVRRAVTEGLRIWTNRDYFKTRPEIAVELLADLRYDPSEYVRKSVGNALRDISKKHRELVREELGTWTLSGKEEKQVYGLASKFLSKGAGNT